jgi:hypothetical protein
MSFKGHTRASGLQGGTIFELPDEELSSVRRLFISDF